jgi:ribosomal protein S3AE
MAQRKVQLVKKKRKWYGIYATKEYGSVLLGESLVSDINKLVGRRLAVGLSLISKTNNPNARVVFEITKVEENRAIAEPKGYYVLSVFIKRNVRRNKSKVDKSYKFVSKDGVNCVIKVFFVTRSKIQSKVSAALQEQLKKALEDVFKKKTFNEIFGGLVSYEIQKSLKKELNKIHPLYALEVRMFYRR